MQKIYLFKAGWTELSPHVRVNSAARAALDSSSPKMAEIVGLLIIKNQTIITCKSKPKTL